MSFDTEWLFFSLPYSLRIALTAMLEEAEISLDEITDPDWDLTSEFGQWESCVPKEISGIWDSLHIDAKVIAAVHAMSLLGMQNYDDDRDKYR